MSLISGMCLVADIASVRALYNGKEKSMVEITGRKRRIAIWVLRVLLGLAFLTIGIAKLTGTLYTV
jgi:hypothetical protein